MKVARGSCAACGRRSATPAGEASDGRPQYRCLNERSRQTWTRGHNGEPWDDQPAPTRRAKVRL